MCVTLDTGSVNTTQSPPQQQPVGLRMFRHECAVDDTVLIPQSHKRSNFLPELLLLLFLQFLLLLLQVFLFDDVAKGLVTFPHCF